MDVNITEQACLLVCVCAGVSVCVFVCLCVAGCTCALNESSVN